MKQLELFPTDKNLPLTQKIAKSKQIIKEALKDQPIALAWSGGKDSTTILILALEVLKETGDRLIVVHSDTLVENPVIREHCDNFLERLKEYVKQEGLNVEVYIAKPKETESFWYNVLVKGYPKPNFKFRWCQKVLKIRPMDNLLKSLNCKNVIVGLREDESKSRNKILQKHYKNHKAKFGENIRIAPITFWTEDDVWEFLAIKSREHTWANIDSIIQLYRDASGECPIVAGISKYKKSGCGARFGCWICTLAEDDTSMRNLAKLDQNLQPLVDFRVWFKEFSDRPENRTGYNRKGEYIGGRVGKLTIQARKEIFNRLLDIQNKTGITTIQDYEIIAFQKLLQDWDR